MRSSLLALLMLNMSLVVLYAEETNRSLFDQVLVSIVADHYGLQLKTDEVTFTKVVESSNIWSSILAINGKGEVTVIVENLNLCVILVDEKGPVLLFQGTQAPPPWTGGAANKTWIYEYMIWRSKRQQ